MPWLSQEAEKRMLAGKQLDPGPNSAQGLEFSGRPGKAAVQVAHLAGVSASMIYDAEHVSERAKTDPAAPSPAASTAYRRAVSQSRGPPRACTVPLPALTRQLGSPHPIGDTVPCYTTKQGHGGAASYSSEGWRHGLMVLCCGH
jgi:hypothetical protein